MTAIAGYRTAILALLSDATMAIFTANDVDQALRWALSEYSARRPLVRTYMYSAIGTTSVHTLPADFVTREIVNVELWDIDPDNIKDIYFNSHYLDEQWVITTHFDYHTGDVFQISYSVVQQIDGLDSAAGTTVPAADETFLQVGTAGRAALMRAMDRIETINMNQDVVDSYHKIGDAYLARFLNWLHLDPGVRVAELDYPEISF